MPQSEGKKKRSRLLLLLAFLLGMLCLFLVQEVWIFAMSCQTHYEFLNPKLPCGDSVGQGEWNYEPLREIFEKKKTELKESGALTHLSIYFRDLDHGPRFGVGEYDQFQPASLTKLPIMIAFLHEADRDPSILDKTLSFSGTLKTDQNTDTADESIKSGKFYTIRDLLRHMIVYSDNYSYVLLVNELNGIPGRTTYYTFRDLDVLAMMIAPKADYVSIQSYANLFAILYNTGYLSKDMSQFALDLLSQATFKDGLNAGVPANIRVAHKFGYRLLDHGESQLHDCGIVYHPLTSYVLCVMTSGTDLKVEESAIAEVSRIVYDNISVLHFRNQGN